MPSLKTIGKLHENVKMLMFTSVANIMSKKQTNHTGRDHGNSSCSPAERACLK